MDSIKKLAQEIKNIRSNVLKLTQKDLSNKLNVTIVYLSYLEQGKKIPSSEFLKRLYSLININDIPDNIKDILSESKKEKKRESFIHTPSNKVYFLEEKNLYTYTKLKSLLKKQPGNLVVIYGILTLLMKEGKISEAKKHLLQSMVNIDKPEERKWLEASYYEIEGNFPFSIQLMNESINEFEKNNPFYDIETNKRRARLYFEIACIYFKYGQFLYYQEKRDEALLKFEKALEYHKDIKRIFKEPYYQMDYASIFFWLALLDINPEDNWENYIIEIKESLLLNYYSGMDKFNTKQWNSLYSKQYMISTISFMVRAYAQLARLKKDKNKVDNLLKEGELLLAQYTPIDISVNSEQYYRYYFNQACFYSIKADILAEEPELSQKELDYCYKALNEALHSDSKNRLKLFHKELKNSKGIYFFRKVQAEKYDELVKKSEKNV